VEIYLIAVVILAGLALSDLVVGVSNDAVNFLNSSIGSKVAPRYIIMIIASLGMVAGVTFSSGMMEVARKGIFHPKFFSMPELMVVFLAVMLTDVLLLDLFNTFGLPTSTTVSIVFELLGAAVAVSFIKVMNAGEGFASIVKYINTAKALAIISGILISVVIAFLVGAILQFVTRLIFTFDFERRLKRYGAIWGGIALSAIVYFILIKGAKGASFISKQDVAWINAHAGLILLAGFVLFGIILQILMLLTRINVLKIIVLVGTFSLAMAFAANDLVNFIGVPLAGLNSYQIAGAGDNPLTMTMEALQKPVQANTYLLLLAGLVMVVTLWSSRKARTVSKTELSLGRQEEGIERFGASPLSRAIVRMATSLGEISRRIIPKSWMAKLDSRMDDRDYKPQPGYDGELPSWDLLRASVNLMVASSLIAIGTSLKLPLSTTYVTFMVAMGTSFSDRAWGRDSAVYRVTGVLTVIGGWFFTALMAFTVAGVFAMAIFFWKIPAVIVILGLAIFFLVRNFRLHKSRESEDEALEVFNLKKVKDVDFAIETSFQHTGIFLNKISQSLEACFQGVRNENRIKLKQLKKETKQIQDWANIIVANIFKVLRLLEKEDVETTHKYSRTISALQEITESQRDIVVRAYQHTVNNHKGLLDVQLEELEQVKDCLTHLLGITASSLMKKEKIDDQVLLEKTEKMNGLMKTFNLNQIKRIQDESSKTRLSILFYGFMRDSQLIAESLLDLLKIFNDSFLNRK
jgi:phosphate/sulfate permease